jgi:hypothetical protein
VGAWVRRGNVGGQERTDAKNRSKEPIQRTGEPVVRVFGRWLERGIILGPRAALTSCSSGPQALALRRALRRRVPWTLALQRRLRSESSAIPPGAGLLGSHPPGRPLTRHRESCSSHRAPDTRRGGLRLGCLGCLAAHRTESRDPLNVRVAAAPLPLAPGERRSCVDAAPPPRRPRERRRALAAAEATDAAAVDLAALRAGRRRSALGTPPSSLLLRPPPPASHPHPHRGHRGKRKVRIARRETGTSFASCRTN